MPGPHIKSFYASMTLVLGVALSITTVTLHSIVHSDDVADPIVSMKNICDCPPPTFTV